MRAQWNVRPIRRSTTSTTELTIRSWLLTLDHKRIALLYLVSLTIFFLLGGAAAALFRLDLMTPQADLLQSETYNKLFTMHGIVMIFFFLIPSIPAVMGNFLVPVMIGARDVAFPRLNLLSWYVFMTGGIMALTAIMLGGVDTGWTFYTPYSSMYANSNVILAVAGAFIAGFSSILTGLNFIVTIQKMRAPGLTWFRLPLFIWAMYATSLVVVLGTPVVAITLVMVFVGARLGFGIFDPKLGGDPVLFQHLFWFYSHPAVYIMILPGMGVISELIACFSRRRCTATVRGLLQPGHRGHRLLRVGPPHVRQQPVHLCRPGLLLPDLLRGDPHRHQDPQLDRMTMYKGSLSLDARCSTPSASSACSPSAA
jgi:cytochrome c oxidase subunit 1